MWPFVSVVPSTGLVAWYNLKIELLLREMKMCFNWRMVNCSDWNISIDSLHSSISRGSHAGLMTTIISLDVGLKMIKRHSWTSVPNWLLWLYFRISFHSKTKLNLPSDSIKTRYLFDFKLPDKFTDLCISYVFFRIAFSLFLLKPGRKTRKNISVLQWIRHSTTSLEIKNKNILSCRLSRNVGETLRTTISLINMWLN